MQQNKISKFPLLIMGKQHFEGNGYPKLDIIIQDIIEFVKNLEIKIIEKPYIGQIIDPRLNADKGMLPWVRDFNPAITGLDFTDKGYYHVREIHVVGSQAPYLQRGDYKVGRDLDLIVMLNIPRLDSFPKDRLYYPVDFMLSVYLGSEFNSRLCKSDPEYGLYVSTFVRGCNHEIEQPEKGPHVQIYPSKQF